MSRSLTNRSPDLSRLVDEGYAVEIRANHLLIHDVPYVTPDRKIDRATLVSELTLAGDVTTMPGTHVVYFTGSVPCRKDGTPLPGILLQTFEPAAVHGIAVRHAFSNKPAGGYTDYYIKMTRYIEIISAHARAVDPSVSARTFQVVREDDFQRMFAYADTATSRAGIGEIVKRVAMKRIAIIGLGGTGAYMLDGLAKVPIAAIHLYDGDRLLQHNAFRAPGAVPLEVLRQQPYKVDYYKELYSNMHLGIVAHPEYVTAVNIHELEDFDAVFVCVDDGPAKKVIIEGLVRMHVEIVDVGMGVMVVEGESSLIGMVRVTSATRTKNDHVARRISFVEGDEDDLYHRNIQIADLNMLNAALALQHWKRMRGFYQNLERAHHSVFSINVTQLTAEEME